MTLRDYLPTWLGGKRASTDPIAFHSDSYVNFGPGIGNQPTHDVLLRESLGIADTATRAIANRVSTLNPLVKVRRRVRDGTTVEETLDDHVLKERLDRPHPNFSRAQLFRLTAQWIVTVGEAYWLKVGNGFDQPIEFHPAPPGKMTPLVQLGVVTGRQADRAGRRSSVPLLLPRPREPVGSRRLPRPRGRHRRLTQVQRPTPPLSL
jgi:hypothetical protein